MLLKTITELNNMVKSIKYQISNSTNDKELRYLEEKLSRVLSEIDYLAWAYIIYK